MCAYELRKTTTSIFENLYVTLFIEVFHNILFLFFNMKWKVCFIIMFYNILSLVFQYEMYIVF